jgi:hypothetical protein
MIPNMLVGHPSRVCTITHHGFHGSAASRKSSRRLQQRKSALIQFKFVLYESSLLDTYFSVNI